MLFSDLALAEPLLRAVSAEGYSTPTPIQAQAIPPILEGRDLIGTAQTGTGKTAAFALPILHRLVEGGAGGSNFRKPRVLVISPTRELATQIGDSFATYGRNTNLRHTVIFGGVGQFPQVKALRRGVDIVVATPGRLLDLFNQGCIRLDEIDILILDEADRMLDMGFMPDIKRIVSQLTARKQTLLFSATMPREIESLAREFLKQPARIQIAPAQPTTDLVEQSVCHVTQGDKPLALAAYLTSRQIDRAVVFTRTKQSAERVAIRLERAGVSADAIHGNKTQAARQRTLANFRANRTLVLVATDVAARGLDVDGISHVVNYDLPTEAETYVHRIGRTGRAGASGIAISFCDGQQRSLLNAIERMLKRKLPVERIDTGSNKPVLAMPSVTPEPREQSQAQDAPQSESQPRESQRREFRPRPTDRKPARPSQGHGSQGSGHSQRRDGERRPQREQQSGGPRKQFGKPKPRPGSRRIEPATMPGPVAENTGDAGAPASQPGETQHPFFRKHRSRPWWQRNKTESGSSSGPQRRKPPRRDSR